MDAHEAEAEKDGKGGEKSAIDPMQVYFKPNDTSVDQIETKKSCMEKLK